MGKVVDIDGNETRGPRIAVCIPSHDMVSAYTMYDFGRMMLQTGVGPLADGSVEAVGVNLAANTYIHRSREMLAEAALNAGADYILWMDADMRFPQDALMRLLLHNRDVVGINYSKRGLPPEYVAVKEVGWEEGEVGERCITGPDSTGLEPVEALGFGLVLMRTDVFRRMMDEKPWFWYEDGANGHVGEDVYFCRLLNEAGIDIYVDHDLSKECAHVGTFEYTTDDVVEATEAIAVGVED